MKTSGSKGFHIVVPLDGKASFGEVARFAHAVGALLVKRDPEHLTQEFSKADRGGRILRRHRPQRLQRDVRRGLRRAAEARRAGLGAVHVGGGRARRRRPRTFTLRTMAARIAEVGDLWADMRKRGRSLRRPIAKLRAIAGAV